MRDEINSTPISNQESLIINIDHSSNDGTHWTCLSTENNMCVYFDSFGLPPPTEVVTYCNALALTSSSNKPLLRLFNTFPLQKPHEVICGHLCIFLLYRLSNGDDFPTVLDTLYNYRNN